MTSDLATAALAALLPGETRVATTELRERLRPAFPALRAEALGRALTVAGWTASQWRLPTGGRVRGYAPPAETAPPTPEISSLRPMRGPRGAKIPPEVSRASTARILPALPVTEAGSDIAGLPGAAATASPVSAATNADTSDDTSIADSLVTISAQPRSGCFRCPTCGGSRFWSPTPIMRLCVPCSERRGNPDPLTEIGWVT